uniref:Uncharacterized protein n=1 Tax=Elaeophora elaphi TaxID=1147741 RepID=A0A158Q7P8_9BILA
MKIRRINLSARLHTNETYESYFKRRVAAVVSNYCEQQADECMATTLRLRKENIVLLKIKPNNLQSTTISFVVTKSQRRSTLSTTTILDSTKVKYVLSAQLAALSRILGGVRIEHVEMAIMEKHRRNSDSETLQQDNFGLLLILSIVATFLTITYTIAAVRVCRDCYAKRRAKKNANKLNNVFETPNYGTCTEPKQNEIRRNYEIRSSVQTKIPEGNDRRNSNPGEIAVIDAYQMRRMFQCDPSQLPAEVPQSPQNSNDSLIIYASKPLSEPKLQICDPKSKQTVHHSSEIEKERKNPALSDKINKISQENESVVEVPQKYANMSARNNGTAETSPHYDSNLTMVPDYQPENEFFKQTKELSKSISEQQMATYNQSEIIPEFMTSNLKEQKINEYLETIWNQPAVESKSTWLPNKESQEKPYSLTNLFSESSFGAADPYNEETHLESYQLNQESKHHAKSEVGDLKRPFLMDQLNYRQESESSDYFARDDTPNRFIQKSQTTHEFDNWSSESDDDGDVYHKLSEADEDRETVKSPEFEDLMEDPIISYSEKNLGLNLDMQYFICTNQSEVSNDEPYYKQLEKSPLLSSPTSNRFKSEEFVSSASMDDLK